MDFIFVAAYRLVGTDIQTIVTQDAAGGTEDEFRLISAALRVMAPAADQRTTFEKNCRSDSGTVMDGITADVKYSTGNQDPTFQSK